MSTIVTALLVTLAVFVLIVLLGGIIGAARKGGRK